MPCVTRSRKRRGVVIDHASIHTSADCDDRLPDWKKQGWSIKYLPPLFSGVEPDRNPVAAHQIYLVAVLGICVSQRIERGVRNYPEPCRIRISNYFCVGTYEYFLVSVMLARA